MSNFNYKKLFIHNIDYKTTYQEIFDAFDRIGKLRYCDVPVDKNKRLKGYAFVEYFDSRLAEVALNRLNNTHIGIRAIKIEFSNKLKEGSTVNQSKSEGLSPRKTTQRDHNRGGRRSRDYEQSEESKRRGSRSPPSYSRKKINSQDIRKDYLKAFYEPGEFYDETPAPAEMDNFLKKTIKEAPTRQVRCQKNKQERVQQRQKR
ncbi:unnamed protein product [Moneuplotes crassus]|uniref:RRM domain-containing protein n=1 Tax=Euplotes crassus TaxID=5936 RepID=A0AAD1XQ72_EUPCR|nr:unnamed protein product [Moneuplotes crassus]